MTTSTTSSSPSALRRIGYAGFAFFLLKGLLWLIAPLVFIGFA